MAMLVNGRWTEEDEAKAKTDKSGAFKRAESGFKDMRPGICELHRVAGPVHKCNANPSLQCTDATTERRLASVGLFGGLREASGLAQSLQIAEKRDVHFRNLIHIVNKVI